MIDTLVSPVEERFSALHREIAGLQTDNYTQDYQDGDDSRLEDELQEFLAGISAEEQMRALSPLGLGATKRYNTRQRVARSALEGYHHRGVVHYTQGNHRWQGILDSDHASEGQFPRYADCSGYASWCYWDSTRLYKLGDFVNGAGWRGGFTGTMVRHGVQISYNQLITGDAVFYGGTYSRPHHVAIYIGRGLVVSHGSEAGPLLLHWAYRPVNHCRRYIR